ncbi:MAG: zf-HC2 domain-containing protein [Verrucomicrobiota bacterium]
MKDSEFIALLNLYLDHEISAEDAARLEAEVQRDPARRKVYQQYCRMQKACKMAAADFVTEPAQPAEKKVVAFDVAAAEATTARRARMGTFYTIGSISAAAACVAIVFVGRSRQAEANEAALLAQQQQAAATASAVAAASPATAPAAKATMVAATAPATAPRPLGGPATQTVHANSSLVDSRLLSVSTPADAVRAAAQQQADMQFAWIGQVQIAPIQQAASTTELRFDTAPATFHTEGRMLGGRATTNNNNPEVESVAFRISK